jgi:hypothetical protein
MSARKAGHCGHLLSVFASRRSVAGGSATRIHTAVLVAKASDEHCTDSRGGELGHNSICALDIGAKTELCCSRDRDRVTALP